MGDGGRPLCPECSQLAEAAKVVERVRRRVRCEPDVVRIRAGLRMLARSLRSAAHC
jgi:hypothetical protein